MQADYILEMQLRRLTRFSKIELEKEQTELERDHRGARRDPRRRRPAAQVVSDELAEVAKTYGTPRRTVLLESAGSAASPPPPRRSRSPTTRASRYSPPPGCWPGPPATSRSAPAAAAPTTTSSSRRSPTTARGEVGVLTSAGRLVRLGRARPAGAPATANDPHLPGGLPLTEMLSLEPDERPLALCRLTSRRSRASRSAPARAWSSGSTPRCSAATTGRSSGSPTATRWSAPSS